MKATFEKAYDCKHSTRFKTKDEDFPIKDVYVKKPYSNGKEKIEIEIKEEVK